MTKREAFEKWYADMRKRHSGDGCDCSIKDWAWYGYQYGYQAAIAAQPGVPVALDPRWKWVWTQSDPSWHTISMVKPVRTKYTWQVEEIRNNVMYFHGMFAGLLPGRLYEILDGRFVERESHA